MNDSRTPTRKTSNKRRNRKVQKTFNTLLAPAGEEAEEFPVLNFETFPYRAALANWPDEWRERWGHRANALEEQGLGWKDAEAQAFFEIQEERRAAMGTPSIPLAAPDIERN